MKPNRFATWIVTKIEDQSRVLIQFSSRLCLVSMDIQSTELDAIDFRILKALSEDGRISDVALGEMISLSSTAVARRRRILEESGVIEGYSAKLSLHALGFAGTVLVMVELSSQAEQILVEFEREVVKCPSVSFCGFVSGDTDFMILIHLSSLDEYDKIYREELSNLPHVSRIRSSFVLREVARRSNVPIIFERGKAGATGSRR